MVSIIYLVQDILSFGAKIYRKILKINVDYRQILFGELLEYLNPPLPARVMEIGPRDLQDTKRLLSLNCNKLSLVDLPDKKAGLLKLLKDIDDDCLELIIGNIMYDDNAFKQEPYDLIWCTGVLYHNPEQLRMICLLRQKLNPGGVLVLESATARRTNNRSQACVEIWHHESDKAHRKHHVSRNVTHLPSSSAIEAWLNLAGFEDILKSKCHKKVSYKLNATRAAFIARKSFNVESESYYSHTDLNYVIGKSL
jgi:hypothetical protein